MIECFLFLSSSFSEYCRVEYGSGLIWIFSFEEISFIKFFGLYWMGEFLFFYDVFYEFFDIVLDDDKDYGKKKGKFKKKEKRIEGYVVFQEDSFGDEVESFFKVKRFKGIYVFKKFSFFKKKEKDFKIKEKFKEEKYKEEKYKEEKYKEKKLKDLIVVDVVKQWKEKKKKKKLIQELEVFQMDVLSVKFIFGVFLVDVVERIMMYDGVWLLVVFWECVDYMEKYGMKCEGVYWVLGIKLKVDELKVVYD